MKTGENKRNINWAYGARVRFVDAYGLNPRIGKIIRFYGEFEVLIEDSRGVVDCAQTWRIVETLPERDGAPANAFDDLLGDTPTPALKKATLFEDLLG
jgi:hypothetical protein